LVAAMHVGFTTETRREAEGLRATGATALLGIELEICIYFGSLIIRCASFMQDVCN
jgi:hypothetical protein